MSWLRELSSWLRSMWTPVEVPVSWIASLWIVLAGSTVSRITLSVMVTSSHAPNWMPSDVLFSIVLPVIVMRLETYGLPGPATPA